MLNNKHNKFQNRFYLSCALSFGLGTAATQYSPESFRGKEGTQTKVEQHYIEKPVSEAELVARILEEYDPNYSVRLAEINDDGLVYLVAGYIDREELGNILESYDNQGDIIEYLGEALHNLESEALEELRFGDSFMGIDNSEQHILEINLFTSDFEAMLSYNGSYEADLVGQFVFIPTEMISENSWFADSSQNTD